jgi:hypothetical protein
VSREGSKLKSGREWKSEAEEGRNQEDVKERRLDLPETAEAAASSRQIRQERREDLRREHGMPRPRRAPLTHAAAARSEMSSRTAVCCHPLSTAACRCPPPSAAICCSIYHLPSYHPPPSAVERHISLPHPAQLASSAGHVTRTRASITTT